MKFNKRVDTLSYPFVDTLYFNQKLEGQYDHIYVTFVAIAGEDKEDLWEDNNELFMVIPLPYSEACSNQALDLMKTQLLNHVQQLEDEALLGFIRRKLELEN